MPVNVEQFGVYPALLKECKEVYSSGMATGKPARKQSVLDNKFQIVGLVVAVIAVVVAYFAWWQPQWKQHEADDLAHLIDNQVGVKLADPIKQIQQIQVDLGKISSKLDTFFELV